MNKQKLLLGAILIIIGLIGVVSTLTMDIPIPAEAEETLKAQFTPFQIKLLLLINPTIMLFTTVLIGTSLYYKVNLKVPFIEKIIGLPNVSFKPFECIKYGVIGT